MSLLLHQDENQKLIIDMSVRLSVLVCSGRARVESVAGPGQ